MDEGYELRSAVDDRDDGVFATRTFAAGGDLMVGFLLEDVTDNDSHATQVGPDRWARQLRARSAVDGAFSGALREEVGE